MFLRPYWIEPGAPSDDFPDVRFALADPNGLLAAGGDLAAERLMSAYRRGIFPWYSEDQPILWWSPNPRAVLFPDELKVSRSLRKTLRQGRFRISVDTAFSAVIDACSAPRGHDHGTWITPEMREAYRHLHSLGQAHSVECWHGGVLAGGLYGVSLGRVFFGESMFSRMSDASKVALAHLREMDFALIDCQLPSAHLARLGAREIPRDAFLRLLDNWCEAPEVRGFGRTAENSA